MNSFLGLEQLDSIAFSSAGSMFIESWIPSIPRFASSRGLNGSGNEGQPEWNKEQGLNTDSDKVGTE